MGFSRQEYWSGLPFTSPGDLPNPGIEPGSPALEADTLTSEPPLSMFNINNLEGRQAKSKPFQELCKIYTFQLLKPTYQKLK